MLCGSFLRVILSKLLCERSHTCTKDLYFIPFYSKEWTRKIFSVSFTQIQLLKNHENLVYCLTLFTNFQYFDKKNMYLNCFFATFQSNSSGPKLITVSITRVKGLSMKWKIVRLSTWKMMSWNTASHLFPVWFHLMGFWMS